MEKFETSSLNQHEVEKDSKKEKKESWIKRTVQSALIMTTLLAVLNTKEANSQEIKKGSEEEGPTPTETNLNEDETDRDLESRLEGISEDMKEMLREQIENLEQLPEQSKETNELMKKHLDEMVKEREDQRDKFFGGIKSSLERFNAVSEIKRETLEINTKLAEQLMEQGYGARSPEVSGLYNELRSVYKRLGDKDEPVEEIIKDRDEIVSKYEGIIAESTPEDGNQEINMQEKDDKMSTSKDAEIIYKQKEEEIKEKETKDITGEDLISNKNEKNNELKPNTEEKSEFSDWTVDSIKNRMLELQNLKYERTLTPEENNQKTELGTVLQEKLSNEVSEEQMNERLHKIQEDKTNLIKNIKDSGDRMSDLRWNQVALLDFEEKALDKILDRTKEKK